MTLVLKVDATGNLLGMVDFPENHVYSQGLESLTASKEGLNFIYNGKSKFSGKLDRHAGTIKGIWTWKNPVPLTFTKLEKDPGFPRPQTPKPPFPYTVEEVRFENKEARVTIAGALTLPQGPGPHPAMLIIEAWTDRNGEHDLHKPFVVIADALARRGIAVLRVDHRGMGRSTSGKKPNMTDNTDSDFTEDARCAVQFMRSRPELDPKKIGLLGWSEGARITAELAGGHENIKFVVLLAGAGYPTTEVNLQQYRGVSLADGRSEEEVEQGLPILKKIESYVLGHQGKDPSELQSGTHKILVEGLAALPTEKVSKWGGTDYMESLLWGIVDSYETPWGHALLKSDPSKHLKRVRCPVLALNGDKDVQVPIANLDKVKEILAKAGNKDVTALRLEGLNHSFQTCKTGSMNEYGLIEESFSPKALEMIGDWVLKHSN